MATKAQKQLERMKSAAASRRRKAAQNRNKMTRRLTGAAASFGLGWAERAGWLDRIPAPMGLPKKLTLAAVALVGEEYVGGRGGDFLEGVGESALYVSLYELGAEGTISGEGNPIVTLDRGVVGDGLALDQDMEQALLEAEVSGYEEELAALEEAEALDVEASE